MGRSVPSYTKVFEDEIKRIIRLKNVVNEDAWKYIDDMVRYLRSKRGILSIDPNPDLQTDIVYLLIIELFRRIGGYERMDNRR
jgi:hypothetical protein